MEFRLLGPLEARSDERAIPLGGPRQRAILAVLILRADHVVSAERLIDDVWGERPPASATAYLQNCISRLRKLLGADRIETRAPGYVLHASPDEIDARRFEQLVARARTMPVAERGTLLRAALELWRGPFLADLAYEPFVQLEAARLDELRLTAFEDRVETDLTLGPASAVVGELEAAVAANPMREHLRALLMLALYRSGRQVDALRAYHDARLLLVEQLGLEPGAELKELERAILTHDPALAASPAEARPAAPPRPEPRREGRKIVTIVFTDLAGSTAIGDALDPEAVRELVGRYFAEMAAVIRSHGGTVEKFVGDAVMAVFGVPVAHEDDALRAVRAALQMRAALPGLNAEFARKWGIEVAIRTGINTGEVVAGDSSSGEAFVSGDAVNVAKRIEEAAAPGEILIGALTGRLLGATATVEPVAPLDVRGKAAPVEAFRVTGLAGGEAIARLAGAPLVGRAADLDVLRAAFADAERRSGCVLVPVLGEPGVGKSRLAAEFARGLGARATVLTGRCAAYGEGATYVPVAEIVRQAVGPDLRVGIDRLLAGDADHELVAERLATVLGEAGAGAGGGETFWAVRRLFETLAAEHPLVVVLDDVHWAEPTLLDLVEYLVGWSRDVPILLVCLARPELLEQRPGWAGPSLVSLEPLDDADSASLVDALAGSAAAVEDAERRLIVKRGDGNPLFLEHLLAYVRDHGADGVPPSLEALLAGRLDQLDATERDVLERAAVLGREFWRGAVENLTPADDRAALGSQLMALVRRRLVLPDRSLLPGEDGFRFQHALVREVAYRATPKARRADLHSRAASWLEDHAHGAEEVVGTHLELAFRYRAELGRVDADAEALAGEAGRRLGAAGMRALQRDDAPAAANLLRRASALLPERDPRRLELLCELGVALKRLQDDSVEGVLQEAADLAAASGERRLELRARVEQAWPRLLSARSTTDDVLRLAADAVPVLANAGDDRGLARAWMLVAAVRGTLQSRWAECEEAAARALAHTGRTSFSPGPCIGMLAAAAYYGPRSVPEALARCEALVAQSDDHVSEASALLWQGCLEAMRGRAGAARACIDRARELYVDLGQRVALLTDWALAAAEVESLADRPDEADRILERALSEWDRSGGDDAWVATLTGALADARYAQGLVEDALRLSAEARAVSPPGDIVSESTWRRTHAKALARTGNPDEAERLAREAVALLESGDMVNDQARALLDLAEVLRAGGREADAAASAEEALGLLEAKGNVVSAERARLLLADLAARVDAG